MNEVIKSEDQGKVTKYNANGQDVTLSHSLVRNHLTKGNGKITDTEIMEFIALCRYNGLNPFLGEAYIIKFGDKPAQKVTTKEAYYRRAETHPEYDGVESGIIVQRGEEVIDVTGAFLSPLDTLLGAWAKVYRKDRNRPSIARINLEEYDKKQSIWLEKKNTMIEKVAKVQAMREAFPSVLNGLYVEEEQSSNFNKQVKEVEAKEVVERNTELFNRCVRDIRNGVRPEQLNARYDISEDIMSEILNDAMSEADVITNEDQELFR